MDYIEEYQLGTLLGVLAWANGEHGEAADVREHVAGLLASAVTNSREVQSYSDENQDLRARVAWLEQHVVDLHAKAASRLVDKDMQAALEKLNAATAHLEKQGLHGISHVVADVLGVPPK